MLFQDKDDISKGGILANVAEKRPSSDVWRKLPISVVKGICLLRILAHHMYILGVRTLYVNFQDDHKQFLLPAKKVLSYEILILKDFFIQDAFWIPYLCVKQFTKYSYSQAQHLSDNEIRKCMKISKIYKFQYRYYFSNLCIFDSLFCWNNQVLIIFKLVWWFLSIPVNLNLLKK